jgi:hypothetical protein
LPETALKERQGLGRSEDLRGYNTLYWLNPDTVQPAEASGAIDWDQNGRIDAVRRRLDLNSDGQQSELAATPNEWSVLVFNGGTIGKQVEVGRLFSLARSQYQKMREPELSEEQRRKIQQSVKQP